MGWRSANRVLSLAVRYIFQVSALILEAHGWDVASVERGHA